MSRTAYGRRAQAMRRRHGGPADLVHEFHVAGAQHVRDGHEYHTKAVRGRQACIRFF